MFAHVTKILYAVENNSVLSAIKKSFLLMIPVVLTGSFALLLLNFPIPAYQEFLAGIGSGFIVSFLSFVVDSTTGFLSLYLVLAISYFYSATLAGENLILRVMAMVTSSACFIASFGGASGSLTLDCFGTIGVFTAMVCSILATRLFFALSPHIFQRYRSYAAGSDIHFRSSMSAIVPSAVCVALFALGNLLLQSGFHVGNFNDLISGLLFNAFGSLQHEPANGIVFLFLLDFLWVFGIHGGNALDPVAQTVFTSEAGSQGIITKSFLDNFTVIGGSGSTLCLLIALLIFSRQKSNRQLAYSAIPLAFFNINEILIFGLPIVLNPVLAIPFIITPIVSMLLAYGAEIIGWMPVTQQALSWTTPVFFSGYMATGSWKGIAVQLVTVIVGTLIYMPFLRLSERLQEGREDYLVGELTKHFQEQKSAEPPRYLDRNDSLGITAKGMIGRLLDDIQNDKVPVFYQPQVDSQDKVVGLEALLRWKYLGKTIFPPLVVTLAQEDGCYHDLTWRILNTVCRDIGTLRQEIGPDIHVSVNIVAEQLNDPDLTEKIIQLAKEKNVCDNLVLEVTEETSLINLPNIASNIDKYGQNGISLAIDDFSMGQTSLNYLWSNRFNYVKLDGGLVRQALENDRSREIIASIAALGQSLNFQIIAEYVESKKARDMLIGLGCSVFQGYFYSPAIPLADVLRYDPSTAVAKAYGFSCPIAPSGSSEEK